MTELPKQDALTLDVTDFGPIAKARIDLRPLTVFIGPSNTGKSYLAMLIYALHRYFNDDDFSWSGRRPFRMVHRISRYDRHRKLRRETIVALKEFAQQILAYDKTLLPDKSIAVPASVMDAIRPLFDVGGSGLGAEIQRCFGLDTAGVLIRKGTAESARVTLQRRIANAAAHVEHRLTIGIQETEFGTTIPKEAPMLIKIKDDYGLIEYLHHVAAEELLVAEKMEESDFLSARLLGSLAALVWPEIVAPLHLPAFYLPADRTGVMHAHSVVVSALIESAATAGLRPAMRTPMLSGILADFLEQLIQLGQPPYRRRMRQSGLGKQGKQIEEKMLGGAVSIKKETVTGYPHFTYQPRGWKRDLPLMNASSMVSELAPVVLYLRHVVRPGNVMIIEEPESHLHPAMQVEFTRQLVALVRAGIRIFVTTHSEWVLEELANIVRRSGLSEASRKEIGKSELALHPDQVGAWLFQPKGRPKGSVVQEIRLDDAGLYPSGFDKIATTLHNDWAAIASQIGESE